MSLPPSQELKVSASDAVVTKTFALVLTTYHKMFCAFPIRRYECSLHQDEIGRVVAVVLSHGLWSIPSVSQNPRTTNHFSKSDSFSTCIVRDLVPSLISVVVLIHETLRSIPEDPAEIPMPENRGTTMRFDHYMAPWKPLNVVLNFIEHAQDSLAAKVRQRHARWLDDVPGGFFAYQDENKIRIEIRSSGLIQIHYLYVENFMQGVEIWAEQWSDWP